MFQGKIFIVKLSTVNGFTAGSVSVDKIAPLQHKTGNDTMEGGSFVSEAFFMSTQTTKVFSRQRCNVFAQQNSNATTEMAVNTNVKVHFRIFVLFLSQSGFA